MRESYTLLSSFDVPINKYTGTRVLDRLKLLMMPIEPAQLIPALSLVTVNLCNDITVESALRGLWSSLPKRDPHRKNWNGEGIGLLVQPTVATLGARVECGDFQAALLQWTEYLGEEEPPTLPVFASDPCAWGESVRRVFWWYGRGLMTLATGIMDVPMAHPTLDDICLPILKQCIPDASGYSIYPCRSEKHGPRCRMLSWGIHIKAIDELEGGVQA